MQKTGNTGHYKGLENTCEICKKDFKTSKKAKYCSDPCRQKAHNIRKNSKVDNLIKWEIILRIGSILLISSMCFYIITLGISYYKNRKLKIDFKTEIKNARLQERRNIFQYLGKNMPSKSAEWLKKNYPQFFKDPTKEKDD